MAQQSVAKILEMHPQTSTSPCFQHEHFAPERHTAQHRSIPYTSYSTFSLISLWYIPTCPRVRTRLHCHSSFRSLWFMHTPPLKLSGGPSCPLEGLMGLGSRSMRVAYIRSAKSASRLAYLYLTSSTARCDHFLAMRVPTMVSPVFCPAISLFPSLSSLAMMLEHGYKA